MNRLDNEDSLELGRLLIKKLVADLDAGDNSSIEPVSKFLLDLPVEALGVCLRQLPLERALMFNLDEDPYFRPVLVKINTAYEKSNDH